MTAAPEPGWSDEGETMVVKVTDSWIVSVSPMIYNDRILLTRREHWPRRGYTAGFCYDKGPAAALAAAVWDPESERYPVGYKKIAYDGRGEF